MLKFQNSSLSIPEGGILFFSLWNWHASTLKLKSFGQQVHPPYPIWTPKTCCLRKKQGLSFWRTKTPEDPAMNLEFLWTNFHGQIVVSAFGFVKLLQFSGVPIFRTKVFIIKNNDSRSNKNLEVLFLFGWGVDFLLHRWTQGAWRSLGIDYKCHVICCRLVHILDPY